MAALVDEVGGVDGTKPRDFTLVSHNICHGASRFLLFSALCLFVVASASGQARQQVADKSAQSTSAQSASAPVASTPSPEVSKYVGAETCKTCHEEIYNNWAKTPHWKTTLNTEGGPSKQGCEGCHGPGAEHVAGGGDVSKIFNPAKHSTKEVDAKCLTCHAGAHPNFDRSPHAKAKVGCISCHSVHDGKEEEKLLKAQQPALCFQCHSDT